VPREFLHLDDVRDVVPGARVVALTRLTGGTRKGVYRLGLDDGATVILYSWASAENYWPPAPAVPDDPFTDASGPALFATNHAALTAAGVRVPRLLHQGAGHALVEDAGAMKLETLMEADPDAAARSLALLGDALRLMHTTSSRSHGRLAALSRNRRTEDIVVDRALAHLDAVAVRDTRLAAVRDAIASHVRDLRSEVPARTAYGLAHGELGPDHVLVTPDGEPVLIDIEGLTYFDVEWEHAWLQMRFQEAYRKLGPVDLDPRRLELYRYAQVLSLIEGPLRIAGTDFPNRQWMLDLAEWNITKALAAL
jgi:hypothetical protein